MFSKEKYKYFETRSMQYGLLFYITEWWHTVIILGSGYFGQKTIVKDIDDFVWVAKIMFVDLCQSHNLNYNV